MALRRTNKNMNGLAVRLQRELSYRKLQMRKLKIYLLGGILLVGTAAPAPAQRSSHDSYYQGMNRQVRQGDYERYSRDDARRHGHDDGGGVGPGKGALIGGAGGAALGAIFGGGLKGTIIGGAAGAGLGALGAKLAEGDDHNRKHR
jgi:hypothetical protein